MVTLLIFVSLFNRGLLVKKEFPFLGANSFITKETLLWNIFISQRKKNRMSQKFVPLKNIIDLIIN